jgi:hypothetical protein
MACHPRVTEWTAIIWTHLPHLTKPQATVLALWSLGMVLARSCALTAVSTFLAPWLRRKEQTVRQQLREFCYEAAAKRGTLRCTLAVEPCFGPLLAWVLCLWQGTPLALALDATTLGTRFTVLVISVVYRGCAIPVAWTVLPATAKHAWRREWLRMLRQVRRAGPPTWTVIVLADRGLYARWLFRRITRLGWHPFLRINTGGTFCVQGQVRGVPLHTLVPQPGTCWSGTGMAFKGRHRQLHCTLLGRWEAGYKDPWLLLTDLPPRCQRCLLVWVAGVDRAGVQNHQTRGLAVAAHAHDAARTGGPPVAGRRRRPLVAAERRWGSRGDHPGQHGPRHHGAGTPAAADAASDPRSTGERLSPRVESPPGGVARPRTAAHRALGARTLAGWATTGGGGNCPAAYRASGGLRTPLAGATGACQRVKT